MSDQGCQRTQNPSFKRPVDQPVGGAVGTDGGRSAEGLAEVSEDGGTRHRLDPFHLTRRWDVKPLNIEKKGKMF